MSVRVNNSGVGGFLVPTDAVVAFSGGSGHEPDFHVGRCVASVRNTGCVLPSAPETGSGALGLFSGKCATQPPWLIHLELSRSAGRRSRRSKGRNRVGLAT